jgi:hypothetical protein
MSDEEGTMMIRLPVRPCSRGARAALFPLFTTSAASFDSTREIPPLMRKNSSLRSQLQDEMTRQWQQRCRTKAMNALFIWKGLIQRIHEYPHITVAAETEHTFITLPVSVGGGTESRLPQL